MCKGKVNVCSATAEERRYSDTERFKIASQSEKGELFYEVTECELEQEDIGRYKTYGIRAVLEETGKKTTVGEVKDISTKRGFVEELARKCNAGKLGMEHFYDVIEDAVAG